MDEPELRLDRVELEQLAERFKGAAYHIPTETTYGKRCQSQMLQQMQQIRTALLNAESLNQEEFAGILSKTTIHTAGSLYQLPTQREDEIFTQMTRAEECAKYGPVAAFLGKMGPPIARIHKEKNGSEYVSVSSNVYIEFRDRIHTMYRAHFPGPNVNRDLTAFDQAIRLAVIENVLDYAEKCFQEEIKPADLSPVQARQFAAFIQGPHELELADTAFGRECNALLQQQRRTLAGNIMRNIGLSYDGFEMMMEDANIKPIEKILPPGDMTNKEQDEALEDIKDFAIESLFMRFLMEQNPPFAEGLQSADEIEEEGEKPLEINLFISEYIAEREALQEEFRQMFPGDETETQLTIFDQAVKLFVLGRGGQEAYKDYLHVLSLRNVDMIPQTLPRRIITRAGMQHLHDDIIEELAAYPIDTSFSRECNQMRQHYFDYVMVSMHKHPILLDQHLSDIMENANQQVKRDILKKKDATVEQLVEALDANMKCIEESSFPQFLDDEKLYNPKTNMIIAHEYLNRREELQKTYRQQNYWKDVEPELEAYDQAFQCQLILDDHDVMIGSYINQLYPPSSGRSL